MPFTLNAHGGAAAGRINPCTGDQVTGGGMFGEHLPPRLQKVPAPASCVDGFHIPEGSVCLPGQWHRWQDRHSGPCHCPLLEVWCFLTRKGLKSHQLQVGHSSSARTPGTRPGSEQPRGDTGLSHVCVALGLLGFSCTGTPWCPLRGSPTPGRSK